MNICFFSPGAYSYFNPDASTFIGGAELQQVLIAKYMVQRGINVSFIVGDYGQSDVEIVGDITIIKSFEPFKGNRKLRFIPDTLKIYRAMKIADADVYNQRSTSFFTGQLAYFASRLGKIFTFSIGIDYNCYRDCMGYLPRPMTFMYRYGLRRAHAIIAQTKDQQRLFKKNFNRDPVLIRNGIIIPPVETPSTEASLINNESSNQDSAGRDRVTEFLWVGSFRRRKRPDIYLQLARRIPQAVFTIIGGKGDDEAYYEEILMESRRIQNVRHIEFVPPFEISNYYRRAYALINTSYLEGFPNTYLHAWVFGVPTLTIEIDPEGVIARNKIGEVTGTFDSLVEAVTRLIEDPASRMGMSERARRYVEKYHNIDDRGEDYIRLFERLLASVPIRSSSRSG